ncbi:hypothetical protein [Streptomyces indicus]|uniref:DUF3558 domain-containing protein n=1 Tax=Streptomyces indicus TaxID=417292 RepID=A0A1G9GQ54_9ACTN|nr:hypothetical protein [Streptomyces indicus]SDL02758.1 hypothetical protein SAMN05421806_116139 [Streptomyces indicus]
MTARRTKVGAGVFALAAGGAIWGFGPWHDNSGPSPADTCNGSLAVREAEEFFQDPELEFDGNTAEWIGHETHHCAAWAGGDNSLGRQLKLNIRPSAAHRASGAAEDSSATPIGYGWNGSFSTTGLETRAAVLIDCAPMAGNGLLVLAEVRREDEQLTDSQVLQVARLATESARLAAEHWGCEGKLGQRPETVDRTPWQSRPATKASGTCRDVVDPQEAARLRITRVSEKPAGRALTEVCTVPLPGKNRHVRLSAYYGPSAQQERYLDDRYPDTVNGAVMRSQNCGGGLGTAYFKFEEFPRPDAEKQIRSTLTSTDARRLLSAFSAASTTRHGCQRH